MASSINSVRTCTAWHHSQFMPLYCFIFDKWKNDLKDKFIEAFSFHEMTLEKKTSQNCNLRFVNLKFENTMLGPFFVSY